MCADKLENNLAIRVLLLYGVILILYIIYNNLNNNTKIKEISKNMFLFPQLGEYFSYIFGLWIYMNINDIVYTIYNNQKKYFLFESFLLKEWFI